MDTPMEFVFPGEVRVIGRVLWFATKLPTPRPHPLVLRISRNRAPLIFPWEHRSFSDLLAAERMRFGITDRYISQIGDLLEQQLGVRLSTRTLLRYEKGDVYQIPRTGGLLALLAVHSLRPTDVFRLLHRWEPAAAQFSLTSLLGLKRTEEPRSSFDPPPSPEQTTQWNQLLRQWKEWPLLLSMNHQQISTQVDSLVRLNPAKQTLELNPMINSGSVVAISDVERALPRNGVFEEEAWNRPLFVFRHEAETQYGYLEAGSMHVALQPHPSAEKPRRLLNRKQIEVLGKITGIASPLNSRDL